jgi:Cathepsin propeptide inhibitor domain (I29)
MNSSQLPHYIKLERRAGSKRSLKLVIAGTVALTAAAVAMLALTHKPVPQFMQFYGDAIHEEKQQAFMQFLARYGKTYASKNDMGNRFQVFSENFDRIKAHNQQGNAY